MVCYQALKFISDCQKLCSYCYIIYTGCRYCLATNIIFGFTNQSQCGKCERILSINIDITMINSGNANTEEFLASTRTDINYKMINNLNNIIIDKNSNPLKIYSFFRYKYNNLSSKPAIEWIPY